MKEKVKQVIKCYMEGKISSNQINGELKGIAFVTKVQQYFGLCNYTYKDLSTGKIYNENL